MVWGPRSDVVSIPEAFIFFQINASIEVFSLGFWIQVTIGEVVKKKRCLAMAMPLGLVQKHPN